MKTSPTLVAVCLVGCAAYALAQHSPAPDRPAEGPLKANPGTSVAPGVHPPAPMDGNRFAPGPPPSQETPVSGRVKTEEKIVAQTPTAGPGGATTPAATSPPGTPSAAKSPTPGPRRLRSRPGPRRTVPAPTPAATRPPA